MRRMFTLVLSMVLLIGVLPTAATTAVAADKENGLVEATPKTFDTDLVVGYDFETGETLYSYKSEALQSYRTKHSIGVNDAINVSSSFEIRAGEVGISPSTIFNDDGRQRVSNANIAPYTAIMFIEGPNATGFMISASCLATAGHVVYNTSTGTWNNMANVKIYPHINGSLSSTYYTVKTVWVSGNYKAGYDVDDDWGMIELTTPTNTNTVSYLGLTSSVNTTSTYTTAGYPYSKGAYTMWSQSAKYDYIYNSFLVSDDFDITAGQSGSPVFDSAYRVNGIVSKGDSFCNYFAYLQASTVAWLNEHKY